ncbi:MAG: hypothetical protein K2J11_01900 [Oscillospiraceae bacterium]|nr:hypothetical protein [Oscillospiraceae bacterium]
MSKLTLIDDLCAIMDVVNEAKSIADLTQGYIENYVPIDSLERDKGSHILHALNSISRTLLTVDGSLAKLSSRYAHEEDDKFASIVYEDLCV